MEAVAECERLQEWKSRATAKIELLEKTIRQLQVVPG
jgi:hypothetical protein